MNTIFKKSIWFVLFGTLSLVLVSCSGNEDADLAYRAAMGDMGAINVGRYASEAWDEFDELSQEDVCKLTLSYYYLCRKGGYDYEMAIRRFAKSYERALELGKKKAIKKFNLLADNEDAAEKLENFYNNRDLMIQAKKALDEAAEKAIANAMIYGDELQEGSCVFFDNEEWETAVITYDTYNSLSEKLQSRLDPMGFVIKLGSKWFMVDYYYTQKLTNWPDAKEGESKTRGKGSWRMPTLEEARQIARNQKKFISNIQRWEHHLGRLDYNPLETFVSDYDPNVYIDVEIEDGRFKVNRTIKGENEDEHRQYNYAAVLYIAEL
ncbi:MAG: hypothetical protein J1E16_07395 [Muribaculaceae bacterium]|nr:hypothetical protein [Muribaculaceae bacterium]